MFATVSLARRIEGAEARLSAEIATTIAQRRPESGPLVLPVGGGVAVFTGPSSPINKLIGLGFEGVPTDADLEMAERAFAARGAPLQAEVSTLAEPAVHTLLATRGYVLQGFENVLGYATRSGETLATRPPAHAVRLTRDDETAAWTTMLIDGFEQPDVQGVPAEQLPPRDVLEAVLGDMSGVASLRRYAIDADGVPVSGAGLRIDDGVAQFTGAATLPAYRRRGMQSACIQERLAAAAAAGCDLAVVTTAPGSRSQENLQALGFTLLYARAVLVKPPSCAPP